MFRSKSDFNRYSHGDESKPEIVRGHITAVSIRAIDNSQICEVIDVNGELHTHVETIVQCGGNHEIFSIMPREIGQEVFLLKTSTAEQPYIIGSVFKPSQVGVSNDIYPTPRVQDRHVPCTTDYYVSNKGNSLNLSNGYGIQLTTSSDMRLQLPSDGLLRISAGGRTADSPLDGARFINQLYKLLEEIRAKEQKIEEMLTEIKNFQVTQNSDLAAFSAGLTAVAQGPLAPIATAAGNLNTATINNTAGSLTTQETLRSEMANLPLRTIQTSKTDVTKALNHKVRLPS